MKYMLMIYSNPATWAHPTFLHQHEALSDAERDGLSGEFAALMKEISESGELVGGEAMADPVNTKTVRVRGNVPATTDGPFAEVKEQLAGYFIVECETEQRALDIAARFPDARFSAVEVRPIMDLSGMEM